MQTFFWSLLLAAISGLTFIAYKHPTGFRKRFGPTLIALAGAAFAYTTGAFAGSVGTISTSLSKQVTHPNADAIQDLASQLALVHKAYGLGLVVCFAVIFYMLFLIFLPDLLDMHQKGSADEGGA